MKTKPLVGITAWRRKLETFYGPERLQTLRVYQSASIFAVIAVAIARNARIRGTPFDEVRWHTEATAGPGSVLVRVAPRTRPREVSRFGWTRGAAFAERDTRPDQRCYNKQDPRQQGPHLSS